MLTETSRRPPKPIPFSFDMSLYSSTVASVHLLDKHLASWLLAKYRLISDSRVVHANHPQYGADRQTTQTRLQKEPSGTDLPRR